MGDVNLEIKLNNIDERVIKIEESGGGSGGDGYITSVSNDFNVVNKKLSLSNDVTTKLSKLNSDGTIDSDNVKLNQILGTVSGDTITFTDSTNTYIGGSDTYLLDAYVSDTDRYIKSQSISGNTLTVVCDDVIASGSIAVCVATKKGV